FARWRICRAETGFPARLVHTLIYGPAARGERPVGGSALSRAAWSFAVRLGVELELRVGLHDPVGQALPPGAQLALEGQPGPGVEPDPHGRRHLAARERDLVLQDTGRAAVDLGVLAELEPRDAERFFEVRLPVLLAGPRGPLSQQQARGQAQAGEPGA